MKAALQSVDSADLLAIAAMALPAAALGISNLLDQAIHRPTLADFLIRSVGVAF